MAGFSSMMLSFPVLMLAQNIDWTNENNLLMARFGFATVQLLCFVLGKYIASRVEAAKDIRTIYVAPPSVSFMGMSSAGNGPKQVRKTTYYAYESEKVKQMTNQTLINAAIMAFMSLQFDIHLPLIMQLVLSPATMLMDPLVGKYLRGSDQVGIYEETLEMPEGAVLQATDETAANEAENANAAPVTAPANAGNGAPTAGSKREKKGAKDIKEATPATRANAELRKFIDATWNANGVTDITTVEALVETGADVNVAVEPDGWTVLHVTAGLSSNPVGVTAKLLSMGADRYAKDADGWTPLHWAAQNNSVNGCKALLQDLDDGSKLELLAIQSDEGEVAIEVAVKAKKKEASVYLMDVFKAVAPEANEDEKAAEPVTEEFAADTEPSSELRQRKPFNTDNIPDID